jgi:hypothetical protein
VHVLRVRLNAAACEDGKDDPEGRQKNRRVVFDTCQ